MYHRFPSLLIGGAPVAQYEGPVMAAGGGGRIFYTENPMGGYSEWTERNKVNAAYIGGSFSSGWDSTFSFGETTQYMCTDGAGAVYLGLYTDSDTMGIIKTTNSGNSWVNIPMPFDPVGAVDQLMVQWANGRLYVSYDSDLYWTNDDGANWTTCDFSGLANGMGMALDIIWTGTNYIVCGAGSSNQGQIAISAAGTIFIDATTLTRNAGDPLRALAYNSTDAVVVCVGHDGRIKSSTDHGVNWTNRTAGSSSTAEFYDVVYTTADDFIAVTHQGAGEVHRSTDNGATWTRTVSGTTYKFGSVLWDGSLVVCVGIKNSNDKVITYTSATGAASSFTERTTDTSFAAGNLGLVAAGVYDATNDQFLIAASDHALNSELQTSPNGTTTWTRKDILAPFAGNFQELVTDDGSHWIITPASPTFSGQSHYSTDNGATWTQCSPAGTYLLKAKWIPHLNLWVGSGVFVTMYSSDGITWSLGTNLVTPQHILFDFATDGTTIVAVGFEAGTGDGVVYTSTDGITFTEETHANTEPLISVTYAEGLFVAGGGEASTNTMVETSPDGATWTEQLNDSSTTGYPMWKVMYDENANAFVGVDAAGGIWHSPDGITWTVDGSNFLNTVPDFLGNYASGADISSNSDTTLMLVGYNGQSYSLSDLAVQRIQGGTGVVSDVSINATVTGNDGEGIDVVCIAPL